MSKIKLLSISGISSLLTLTSFSAGASDLQAKYSEIVKSTTMTTEQLATGVDWNSKDKKSSITNQVVRDELTFQQIRKSLIIPFEKQVRSPQARSFTELVHGKNFAFGGAPVSLLKTSQDMDGIKTYVFPDQEGFYSGLQGLQNYLKNFKEVADFRIDVKAYFIDMRDRLAANSEPKKMTLHGHLDLRGIDTKSQRRNDSGPVEMVVEKSGTQWVLQRMTFGKMTAVVSTRTPAFQEITQNAFKDSSLPSGLRREAIRRGGYALSLTDVNGDGVVDLYAGSGSSSRLWFGDGKGGFVLAKNSGVEKDSLVKTALFADFQNSGKKDLFVTTFNPQSQREDLVVYANDGKGQFTRLGDPARGLARLDSYYPMPAAIADFDGDGLLDVYVGFPGSKDFTFLNVEGNQVAGGKKSVQGMFWNKGNLSFQETPLMMPTMKEGNRQFLFPHSAMAIDIFQKKKMDIVVIDDQDNLSPVYRNDGKGNFEQVAEKIGLADTSNGMSVAAGDFNNDGLIDFAMTSVNNFAADRIAYALETIWGDPFRILNGKAVRLFQQTKSGKFIEVTDAAGVNFAGAGGAGVTFVDYNNDGLQDMFVSNGLWSGDDRDQEVDYVLEIGRLMKTIHVDVLKDRSNSAQSDFMNFLVDFRGDIFHPQLKGKKTLSSSGYQRKRLFRNNGDGTFTDVAYLEGVDSIYDGYIVARASLTQDGRTDLILQNGEPGQKSYKFPQVQVFKNVHTNKKSLELKLIGTATNRDAVGVGVTATIGNRNVYQQVIMNEGPAQSEGVLHFGLGNAKVVEKVVIHWPQGDQELVNLKPGRTVIEQPAAIKKTASRQ